MALHGVVPASLFQQGFLSANVLDNLPHDLVEVKVGHRHSRKLDVQSFEAALNSSNNNVIEWQGGHIMLFFVVCTQNVITVEKSQNKTQVIYEKKKASLEKLGLSM